MNKKYPHRVVVYRESIDTSSIDQTIIPEVLLESECNSHPSGNRTTRVLVNESKFVLNLPRHTVRIIAGDKVNVYLPDRMVVGNVVDSIVSNMSAYIFYDEIKQ